MKHLTELSAWESIKDTFDSEDSFKVCYNKEGTILGAIKNPKELNVEGCVGVLEVPSLPEPWNQSVGWWVNADKGVIERDPLMNPWIKRRKMDYALRKIQEAELLESMRPTSRSAMFIALPNAQVEPLDSAMWMNYLFDLSKIDETVNEDLEWPTKPEE